MKYQVIGVCFFMAALFGPSFSEDQQLPGTMTRVVVYRQGPDIAKDSFAAQPKTIYRAGTRYCRVEEVPDNAHGIHGLVIINEPDIWFVNLFTKTAQHLVNSGPAQCQLPLFADEDGKPPSNANMQTSQLEIGHEVSYFKDSGVQPVAGPTLFGKPTQAYTIEKKGSRLQLFTTGTPERPVAVLRERGTKQEFCFYANFDEVPFDDKFFARPTDVKIEDVNPSKPQKKP
jgi:hypothetical protein